ncbi:Low conductance mechanosensitive channel YnaI [Rubripirellula obstinata]|uniref:Low conductance mechanosensitive channel YnaI n=1 Tax=Rubripirellula obstinata TaxID=406547 RepID=A0A5B1CMM9_9BACT|nr:mechanosensitive ion channel family protein [Rubripirellula obstinata]KAA1261165.1 Low conductance mechanosensitive channel YnaI [Rubripirellula obstinata]
MSTSAKSYAMTSQQLFRALAAFVLLACVSDSACAQSLLSSGDSHPDGGRPKSTQVGFFELMESGGDAMLDLFQPEHQKFTAESPEYDSQASPRDALMTFVEAMNHVAQGRREPLDRALGVLPAGTNNPEQVATDLLHVFDRLPEISPGTIPGEKMVADQKITRFELFPRGIASDWAYKAIGSAPQGSIVLVENGDQWNFSEKTASGAADLLDSLKAIPPRKRIERKGDLFLSVVEPTYRKTSAVDWLLAIVWTVAGIAVAWLVYKGVTKLIAKRESDGDNFITPILSSLMIPAVILLIVLGAAIGSAKIYMHPALSAFRWNLIEAAMVLAGVYLIVSLIELLCLGVRRTFYGDDDPYAKMMSLVVRRGLRVFATVVLLLFVFQNVFKWNVTALIGGFSIIALALSLAAQDAVKNLFGALTIFASRPFIKGDWIKFAGEIGQVEDVSLQVTRVRLLSGEVLSVPNMKFIDDTVENMSMRKYLRRIMDVQITYDTPAHKVNEAIDILNDILNSDPIVSDGQADLDAHPPQVWFEEFGSHYLNIRADYWYMMDEDSTSPQRDTERGWFSYLDHATIVNTMLLERFNDAGIDFAFPTQSIRLSNEMGEALVS